MYTKETGKGQETSKGRHSTLFVKRFCDHVQECENARDKDQPPPFVTCHTHHYSPMHHVPHHLRAPKTNNPPHCCYGEANKSMKELMLTHPMCFWNFLYSQNPMTKFSSVKNYNDASWESPMSSSYSTEDGYIPKTGCCSLFSKTLILLLRLTVVPTKMMPSSVTASLLRRNPYFQHRKPNIGT
jgi:hypothetical protein